MNSTSAVIQVFARDDGGATAIEYSLIIAAIALLIVGALQQLGVQLEAVFAALIAGFS